MDVAARIIGFRESSGISKNQLAKSAGVSQSYIGDIESGRKNPTIDILEKITAALGISLAQLLSDDSSSLDPDIQQLIETTKKLPPEERKALNEYLKVRLSMSALHQSNVAALQPKNDDKPTYELNQAAIDGKPSEITEEDRRMFEEKKRLFKELNGEKN